MPMNFLKWIYPMLHGYGNIEMDTTRGKFLKIYTTRVSNTFRTL